ncbi:MAG: sigma-70 family RNA polymerase sigma factor [Solirubrobacteraceae bacterium]
MSTVDQLSAPRRRALLDAARNGDEGAYQRLVEPHRVELHAHCYRMLGSLQDAEDALQDALVRAWRALDRFEGRSSLRGWLYRIATNTCLTEIERRPRRVLPIDMGPDTEAHSGPGTPLAESVWVEPYPDDGTGPSAPEARVEQREGVELAFVAALQHLPPRQRAVLILREVLGFSAREVAGTLESTEASVNSALQRARKTLDERLPVRSQQANLRALGDNDVRRIVDRYMAAWERGDVDGIVELLAADAALGMPPMSTWYRGEQIVVFLREWAFSGRVYDLEGRRRVRVLPTRANAQPALGVYAWSDEHAEFRPTVLQVLSFDGDRVSEVMGFVLPRLFPHFGLPEALPAE